MPSQSVGCRSQDGAKWDLRSGDETHRLVMRKKNPVNIAIENHLQIGVLIGTSSLSLSLSPWVISIATVDYLRVY